MVVMGMTRPARDLEDKNTLVLQPGPHADVASYCLHLQKDILSNCAVNGAELYALSQATQRMLVSDSLAERMSAVQEALNMRPDCGLPYLVLAREGASVAECGKVLYRP
jgi:hypothetical protein